jgi:HAE1 family hydrophobic/amphiphilic exporter-1
LIFLGNSRATIISALAIPTSIIAAFGVMWAQGVTLNVISLVALALAVGIVIDDAIIVVENIFRHMEEKGEDSFTASVKDRRRSAWPSWPPRFRCSRCSCPWPSSAASWACS